MKMISKSKLKEIRRSLFDDDGHARQNNPHFDLIFEEAFKAGMKQVNNVALGDVSGCEEEEQTDCGCPPETCKMLKGSCKNLAYR